MSVCSRDTVRVTVVRSTKEFSICPSFLLCRVVVRPSVRPRPSLFLQPRLKLFDHQLILPARARPLPRPPPPPPPLPCKGAAKSEEDYDSKSSLRIGALSQPRMRIAVASSSKEPSRLPTEPGARERACHLKHVVIGIATTRTTDICD